jgi:hypothetical protein
MEHQPKQDAMCTLHAAASTHVKQVIPTSGTITQTEYQAQAYLFCCLGCCCSCRCFSLPSPLLLFLLLLPPARCLCFCLLLARCLFLRALQHQCRQMANKQVYKQSTHK